jgi:hypothetical protein
MSTDLNEYTNIATEVEIDRGGNTRNHYGINYVVNYWKTGVAVTERSSGLMFESDVKTKSVRWDSVDFPKGYSIVSSMVDGVWRYKAVNDHHYLLVTITDKRNPQTTTISVVSKWGNKISIVYADQWNTVTIIEEMSKDAITVSMGSDEIVEHPTYVSNYFTVFERAKSVEIIPKAADSVTALLYPDAVELLSKNSDWKVLCTGNTSSISLNDDATLSVMYQYKEIDNRRSVLAIKIDLTTGKKLVSSLILKETEEENVFVVQEAVGEGNK